MNIRKDIENYELVKLAVDTYKGDLGNYSREKADEVLRNKLIEIAGTDKIDYKTMRRFKPEVFAVIEEAIDFLVVQGLTNQFDDFVEIRNLAWGDTNIFTVEDPSLFKVATISNGTNNLRRQRLDNGSFSVEVSNHGIKIYEELYRFLAGRINWVQLVNKVSESYNKDVSNNIYNAIVTALGNISSPYRVAGAYDEAELRKIISHVEAASDTNALIMGTKTALAKIATAVVSERAKETMNATGHYGVFNGTPIMSIKQAHKVGDSTEFIIDDDLLIVVPQPMDKMVKLVIEGDAIIQETAGGMNMDQSLEYLFTKMYGIAVVPGQKLGVYDMS